MKTADRPHVITLLLSLGALVVSLFSLQQSCTAERVSRATSRAMLIFKSAQLAGLSISVTPETIATPQKQPLSLLLASQVENVGKAIAHNPSLRYDDVELLPVGGPQTGVTRIGTIKFMDDPPGTPVTAVATVAVPYHARSSEKIPTLGLTLHYKLSYDDEATGTHFDEKESCVETVAENGKKSSFHPCF